ncbi:hypothetical protein NPIL_541801 [Nephila pilipes]|uniref:Uncharacterized protein n=1 Tax=Nephila pilipes TaxID=299642 RepID=A0A8X6PIL2_NEPPI|nr:hypothetical protein NPIL_541801 [Nephila pilipes]
MEDIQRAGCLLHLSLDPVTEHVGEYAQCRLTLHLPDQINPTLRHELLLCLANNPYGDCFGAHWRKFGDEDFVFAQAVFAIQCMGEGGGEIGTVLKRSHQNLSFPRHQI